MKSLLTRRISVDARILHGKPRVRGTRIAVSMVLELLAQGITPKEIREKFYPDLTLQDIYACVAYANQFINEEEVHFYEELKHAS